MSKDKDQAKAAPRSMRVFALNLEELEASTHAQCARVWDMLEDGDDPIGLIAEAVEEYTDTDPRAVAGLAAKYANTMLHLAAATRGLSHTDTTPDTAEDTADEDTVQNLSTSVRKVMDSLVAQARERIAHTIAPMMFSGRPHVERTLQSTLDRIHNTIHDGTVDRTTLLNVGVDVIHAANVSYPDLEYAVAYMTVRLASALCLGEDLYHQDTDTAKDDTTAESGE